MQDSPRYVLLTAEKRKAELTFYCLNRKAHFTKISIIRKIGLTGDK